MIFNRNEHKAVVALLGAGSMGTAIVPSSSMAPTCSSMVVSSLQSELENINWGKTRRAEKHQPLPALAKRGAAAGQDGVIEDDYKWCSTPPLPLSIKGRGVVSTPHL